MNILPFVGRNASLLLFNPFFYWIVWANQMAKWQDKELKDLTDTELLAANQSMVSMREFVEGKKLDPRYAKKFENQPLPEPNPSFVILKNEIEAEINNRKLIVS